MLNHDPDAPELDGDEMDALEAERSDERHDRKTDDEMTGGVND